MSTYAWKHEYWTTSDGRVFQTKEAADAHMAALSKRDDSVTCSCGTKRASGFTQCPNVACHQDRIDRLRERRAPIARLAAEYAATWTPTGNGKTQQLSERAREKWLERIAVACWSGWDEQEALDRTIANFDRQIAEEERIIADLRAAPAREEGRGS